jgi:RNA polymerase sigma-70 factor (ECF subfamily)
MQSSSRPTESDPDVLLARYRGEGRPAHLAALFDIASPELFQLALRLCPDAATAEDVLQETFVVVIERAEAWDPARPAMPWLTGILKNAARMNRRSAARRPDPERLPPLESEDDPALVAEDSEERARVREAMDRLPEPLRGAALLRWRYGLEPAEIAHVRGVPPGTVRSWLHRAVQSIKVDVGALPALFLIFRPERGLEGVRAALLRRAAARVGAAGAAGTGAAVTSALAVGGVLMAKKVVIACIVVLLVVAAGLLSRQPSDLSTSGGTAASGEPAFAARASRPSRRAAGVGSDVDPAPVDLSALDRDRDLNGVVVREDGSPVAGAAIEALRNPWTRLNTWLDRGEMVVQGSTRSAEDGTFALRLRRGDVVMLRTSKEGLAPVDLLNVQAGERVRVVLEPGVRLVVAVKDEAGNAIPGLSLELGHTGEDAVARVVRRIATDAGGVAVADGLAARTQIWLAPTRLGSPDPNLAVLPASGEARLDVVLHPGQPLRGTVVDAETGRPVAGARVGVDWKLFGAVLSGADGTYSITAVRPLQGVKSLHVLADGYARTVAQVAETDSVIDLALHRPFRLRGRIVSADGRPLADALVSVAANTVVETTWHFSIGDARTGPDGRFAVDGLDREIEHLLTAAAQGAGLVRRTVGRPSAGDEEVDVGDVVLPTARSIEGRLQDLAGDLLARRSVVVAGPTLAGGTLAADAVTESRPTDDLGRFRFTDLIPGSYRLSSTVPGEPAVSTDVIVPPDQDVRDVVLRAGQTRTVTVHVVDEAGAAIPGAIICASTSAGSVGSAVSGQDGVVRLTTSTGELDLRYVGVWERLAGGDFLPAEAVKVAAGGSTELTFALRGGAAVSGTVLDPDGPPIAGVWVKALTAQLQSSGAWTDASGRFRIVLPRNGTVDLVVDGSANVDGRPVDLLLAGRADSVAPGTSGVVIRCAAVAADRTLIVRVTTPDGAPAEGVIVDARCSANSQPATATTDAQGRATLRDLTSRPYIVGAGAKDAWLPPRAQGTGIVPSGQEVTLVLRPSAQICGTVETADGRGVAGVRVNVGADEALGFAGWGVSTDERGEFMLLVPAEARGTFALRALGIVDGAQVRASLDDAHAGDTGVRLVVRK